MWSLSLWKFFTEAFQDRQGWNLTSERQPRQGSSEEEQRQNYFFLNTGCGVHHFIFISQKMKQNMTGRLRNAVKQSAPLLMSMIWTLSPSSGSWETQQSLQDIYVNYCVSWQEVSLSASNDSRSILMANFQALFLYLHYQGSMDDFRIHCPVCWPGTIC